MDYRLADVFDLQMGKTPDRKNLEYWSNGSNQWISIADMSKCNKYIENTAEYITDSAIDYSGIKVIPKNTVIMSFKLSIGKVAITTKPMYSNEAIMAFLDKGVAKINSSYLYYLLKHKNWNIGTNKAVMGKTLNKATLSNFKISIHEYNSQIKIVKVLDKASKIISFRKQQLSTLDTLVKAQFVEMFGDPVSNPMKWDTSELRNNTTLLNGRAYKQDELLDNGKYPVLRVGNFFSNKSWYYSNLELEKDKYCENGDLLYAWSASFGPKIWNGGKVIYHYHIWKIIIGDSYEKHFLCKLLDYVTNSLMSDTHGIAMMHLTKSGMEHTKLIIPPIELQKQFADFVAQVNKSKVVVQKALDEAQTLFDSFMQQYFG